VLRHLFSDNLKVQENVVEKLGNIFYLMHPLFTNRGT